MGVLCCGQCISPQVAPLITIPVEQATMLVEPSTQPSHNIAHPERGSQHNPQHGTFAFICHYLISHIKDNQTKLGITETTPVQVWNKFSLQREYLKTNYEEADAIIVHLLVRIAS